jgi:hypothetical protein
MVSQLPLLGFKTVSPLRLSKATLDDDEILSIT